MTNQNAIEVFVEHVQAAFNEKYKDVDARIHRPKIETKVGQKYTKLFARTPASGSIFCFIDNATGDIYKAAGVQAPAKGIKGNVNSEQNGMEAVSLQGVPHIFYNRG